jgi:predicted RNA-binding protein YlxR (DUF448 family)
MSTTFHREKHPRPRHVAERTCIGCREIKPKQELIRIVRTESGGVAIDPTGKRSGRGAYLCKVKTCWEAGLKKEQLDRALRMKIAAEDRKGLAQYGEMLPS